MRNDLILRCYNTTQHKSGDRSAAVKEACISLIKKWVSYYNNDIIKLLKALDVEGKVDLCGEVVTEILNHVHIDSASECLLSRIENKGAV